MFVFLARRSRRRRSGREPPTAPTGRIIDGPWAMLEVGRSDRSGSSLAFDAGSDLDLLAGGVGERSLSFRLGNPLAYR